MIARLLLALWLVLGWSAPTLARDAPPTYARVVAAEAPLRSGPGPDFRVLHTARREDRFIVRGRAPVGYWLELGLPDGGRAYVQGELVWLYDASEGEPPPYADSVLFAPPPLLSARGELGVVLGALGGSGFLAFRPSVLLGPTFAIEASLGASVGSLGRLFMLGIGGLVNLFPSWPVTPFFVGGGGGLRASPNRDTLVLESGTRSMFYGGGGLRFGFRHRLIVRVEARGYALFDADHLASKQEISGGLSAFF